MRLLLPLLLLAVSFAPACGSDSSNTTSSCEIAGQRLCERACACGVDKCRFVSVADGGGGASISFDSLQKCTDFYVTLGCSGGGSPKIDYAACSAAAVAAVCVDSGTKKGVESPKACQ